MVPVLVGWFSPKVQYSLNEHVISKVEDLHGVGGLKEHQLSYVEGNRLD